MSTATPTYPWLWFAGGVVVVCAARQLMRQKLPAPLPPGPKGLPIVGNTLQWPKEKSWEVFTEWGQTYGDIIYVNLFGQHAVILNDPILAVELLDRKSSAYSDRPMLYVAGELAEYKHTITLMQYGKPMRQQRDLITRAIGSKASLAVYEHMQEAQIHRFIRDVLDEPDRLTDHARKLAAAIILNIAYGYQVKQGQDDLVTLANEAMHGFGAATTPGRFIVDVFPSIDFLPSWFPGLKYRQVAADMLKTQHKFLNKPYNYVQDQLRAGTAIPSFVATHIAHKDKEEMTPEYEHLVKWGALTMFGGGSDTSVSSFQTFFLAMTLFPHVQVKAREEIDAVLGPGYLPRNSDRERLPYVKAVFLEVLRWGQVVPQGVAHVSREDDVHRGYFIPKGTIVVPNIWKFTHDPNTYTDPMSFKPERFLKTNDHAPEVDPREFFFGYGRRVCPGRQLAEQSVWLLCATSLATLDVSKQFSNSGQTLEPKVEYVGHLITHPKDFPCQIKARSRRMEDLIRHAVQDTN